ncbi:hypothetical protein AAJ76_5100015841 [Vairimorpha ceranae]|uniref:Uncharacterized protein n=1 Tax=Vairimorpha ceranae TaxID=40302 RepID=A0A0F9WAR0_9MICR|nr:hypothetical protein AAJ76_5100015841 [Vairimorpha ceranae]KKO74681.1 hypothetical protein AAJ76_5100015841 [Vairimorpha ceranae]
MIDSKHVLYVSTICYLYIFYILVINPFVNENSKQEDFIIMISGLLFSVIFSIYYFLKINIFALK